MLEEKYQTLKQTIYNEIVTCGVMLEPSTGQLSDHADDIREEIEKPLDSKVTPPMDPTAKRVSRQVR